jgi:hypothetical protein
MTCDRNGSGRGDDEGGLHAMLTLVEAARKIGLTTLARAIKSGRVSVSRKEDGSYEVDPVELARVYPFPAPGETMMAAGPTVRHATPDVIRFRLLAR